MKIKKSCFNKHRKINATEKLKEDIYNYVESLIKNENVSEFLFYIKSKF